MTDLAAIDLVAAQVRADHDDPNKLIAAVETLRGRVAELTEPHDGPCYYCGRTTNGLAGNPSEWPLMFCHKEEPGVSKHHHVGCVTKKLRSAEAAEARVAELEGIVLKVNEANDTWCARAEAAEARGVELAGALDNLRHSFCMSECINLDREHFDECEHATATLAATPTAALERARARDAVVSAAKRYAGAGYHGSDELDAALGRLGALGQEPTP